MNIYNYKKISGRMVANDYIVGTSTMLLCAVMLSGRTCMVVCDVMITYWHLM